VSVLEGRYDAPSTPFIQQLWPTAHTLVLYVLVAVFNSVLVVLWGLYNKKLFQSRRRGGDATASVDDETVATHFHLSCNQLHEIQGSRVTVIYHSNEGDISHLETDQLRMQPAGNNPV